MYSNQAEFVNSLQFAPQPTSFEAPNSHRSLWLIGFGVTQITLSSILLGFCFWSVILNNGIVSTYLGLICAVVHISLGFVAVIGGRNGNRFRPCIIASLVLGIVGPVIFVSATLGSSIIEYTSDMYTCYACKEPDSFTPCPSRCLDPGNPNAIYIPILCFILLEAAVGITLASISCCNLFHCCGCCYTGSYHNLSFNQLNVPPSYVPFDNVQPAVNYAENYNNYCDNVHQ